MLRVFVTSAFGALLLVGLSSSRKSLAFEEASQDTAEAKRNRRLLQIYREQAESYRFGIVGTDVEFQLHEFTRRDERRSRQPRPALGQINQADGHRWVSVPLS